MSASSPAAGRVYPPDHAAGDFRAGISGGLRREIVRAVMDDDGSANHLIHRKAVGQEYGEGSLAVPEERRKISGVVRMPAVIGIIVGHGVRERLIHAALAAGSFMDMKSENLLMAGAAALRQAPNHGADEYAAAGLEKPHKARELRIMFAARDAGLRLRSAAQEREKLDRGMIAGWWLVHMKDSLSSALHTASYAEKDRGVRSGPETGA